MRFEVFTKLNLFSNKVWPYRVSAAAVISPSWGQLWVKVETRRRGDTNHQTENRWRFPGDGCETLHTHTRSLPAGRSARMPRSLNTDTSVHANRFSLLLGFMLTPSPDLSWQCECRRIHVGNVWVNRWASGSWQWFCRIHKTSRSTKKI